MTEAVIVYAIVALVALASLVYVVEPDDLTTMAAVCVLAAIWPFLLLGVGIAAVVAFKARVR